MNVNAANFDPNHMGYDMDPSTPAGQPYGDGTMYGSGASAPQSAPDITPPYAYDSIEVAGQSASYNPYATEETIEGGGGVGGAYMASDPQISAFGGGAEHPQMTVEPQHYMDHHHHQDPTASVTIQGAIPAAADDAIPGMYYQTGHFAPQNIDGAPISAIALDYHSQAMYIASHTQRIGSAGFAGNTHPHAKTTPFDQTSNTTSTAASMLVTHSTTDGMLYSSCAGHPQADLSILRSLNKLMYGGGASPMASTSPSLSVSGSAPSATTFNRRIPPHAYVPPFGVGHASATSTAAPAPSTSTSVVGTTPTNSLNESLYNSYQMGINSLLAFSTGYVASISPATVRVHNQGGLLVSDSNLRGMVKGCPHPSINGADGVASMTHITVGGMIGDRPAKNSAPNAISVTTASMSRQHLHCLDLYQNLRPISSHGLKHNNVGGGELAVTALATNHETKTIVAGCTDGTIRILDGSWRKRGGIEVAKIKSHMGGVTDISISDDGRLICTAGFSARASLDSIRPYAFEDNFVYIYDVRFLGRGGILHPFSGMGGAPHFVNFVPSATNDVSSNHNSRVLVCSGRKGTPGMQFITPFDENSGDNPDNFLSCYMESDEFITDMYTGGNELILGTSSGNITQYRMAEDYETKTIHAFGAGGVGANAGAAEFYPLNTGANHTSGRGLSATSRYSSTIPQEEKDPLVMPASYVPEVPALSINPTMLHNNTESVFNSYILCANPKLTLLHSDEKEGKSHHSNTFGPLAKKPLLIPPKRKVSERVMKAAIKQDGDYMATVKTEYLDLNLLAKEAPKAGKEKGTKRNTKSPNNKYDPSLNSNKLLYCKELSKVVYDTTSQKTSSWGKRRAGFDTYLDDAGELQEDQSGDGAGIVIPRRYRCTFRPSYVGPSSFDHAKFNSTGLWPGWEYPPSASNATIPPVLLMLYFVADVRSTMLRVQSDALALPPHQQNQNSKYMTLSQEIGYLFHQIENISAHAITYPQVTSRDEKAHVGAFVPYNFLATFASMPEADSLALLDGAPAATTAARRPEAFYRFLLHHIDKELTSKNCTMLMDSLHGLDFTSVNEFLTGSSEPPTVSCTRERSVDLGYEPFIEKDKKPLFGEVLRHSLCKESRLRAWCKGTRTYETVVQRKIATSLPQILSLCCSCAGERFEKDRLPIWRTKPSKNGGLWLPEMIEIQLEHDGNVVVRELQGEEWIAFQGESSLPPAVSEKLINESSEGPRKVKYRLTSVLSYIRDDKASSNSEKQSCEGHHVLQVRVPHRYKKRALHRQYEETNKIVLAKEASEKESSGVNDDNDCDSIKWTLTANTNKKVFEKRCEHLKSQLNSLLSTNNDSESDWVIVNGFVVAKTKAEDARDFSSPFKEPCLVTYSAVDKSDDTVEADNRIVNPSEEVFKEIVPVGILDTRSISTGQAPQVPKVREIISEKDLARRPWLATKSPCLPNAGELIAFDAEFVQVQDEESVLTDSGSKVTVREARNALARISLIDCSNDNVLVDDYILPREPVVDYLTRFSGIVAKDLHPKQSPHHLVTMRSAYLKLRLMVERGCIFVGHGLGQDFLMVNLFVPPSQIIDTVEIFHKDRMRYISLRFLANYLLGTDMQQDTHDSIEDATTAFQIYRKALEFKANGTFDKVLNDIYEFGQKTDWKLGVEESS